MLHSDWIGKDPTADDGIAAHYLLYECDPETSVWALSTRGLTLARRAPLRSIH
jgi:hypothetical protein